MGNWQQLRDYRKRRRVSLDELATETGRSLTAIWRREQAPSHKEHVAIGTAELLELCAAIERVVEKRDENATPAEVLSE